MLANKLNSPKLYYGWVIVGVSTLILFAAFGIRLSFSVFFVALIDDFGWSRADTSLIFSITMLVFAATSTMAGIMLDRLGSRVTFTSGAVVLGTGLLLSSQIQSLVELALTYGVIAGIGITVLGLSIHASVVRTWFKQRLGAAIGVAFAGTGLGAFIVTPSAEALIRNFDWRTAMIFLGLLILTMIIPIQLFLVDSPEQLGLQIDGEERGEQQEKRDKSAQSKTEWSFQNVVRTPAFWLLFLAGVCAIAPVRMLTVHQFAIMADGGISPEIGARAIGLSGIVAAVTFILGGALSDKIGRIATYALGGVCLIGAFWVTTQFALGWTVWPYALLVGIGEGSRSSLVSATTADIFAGRTLGAISGTIGAAYGLGAAILPWLAGWLFDEMGSYTLALWLAAGVTLISLGALASASNAHFRSLSVNDSADFRKSSCKI
ncbi:MAG: MFS family permease [Cellvibrionaceae bacterium]|jgi:MFS family permease